MNFPSNCLGIVTGNYIHSLQVNNYVEGRHLRTLSPVWQSTVFLIFLWWRSIFYTYFAKKFLTYNVEQDLRIFSLYRNEF